MGVQELIEKYKKYENALYDIGARVACQNFLKDLEQLDEPGKVKVPQFVADWIEESKQHCENVVEFFGCRNLSFEITKWIEEGKRFDLIARAWLDCYEVEEENQYVVTLKNRQPLVKSQSGSILYFSQDITAGNYKVTRKELEEAGFGWVFDCPGVEVEEVK